MRLLLLTTLLAFTALSPAAAQEKTGLKSISETTRGMDKIDGFFPLYWDAGKGEMRMAISRWDTELLYQVYLSTGVGSNDLGLDRSQLGGGHVVRFERVGSKVLMVEPNYNFRALTPDAAQRRAVEESFGRSVLWGFEVIAADPDGSVLVDATKFFLRDAGDVVGQLRDTKQGDYDLEDSRSAFYIPRTKGFRKNTEVEVSLTFTTGGPAPDNNLLEDVVPTRQALTVREHHSLVELPGAGYTPRRLDPRVGYFSVSFYDFASPYTEPLEKRWISRHRLQKRDPSAAVSEPVKPIVYYVDSGAPEPVRRALVEGASWWNAAFEAAGFRNAFQVKVLPPDADPMDVSYNVISWVGRTTRGWSYGESVIDPRTGEIIKGNVRLDALRARQDYLIASGLVAPRGGAGASRTRCDLGTGPDADDLARLDPSADPEQLALARVRQLAAHETGHTLGLAHNYAASTYGRASVMDYPAPSVEIKGGKLDLSNAYAVGVGDYDKFAIRYGYAQFAPGADESAELEKLVEGGLKAGMLFVSDADETGGAHPLANRWDNGSDSVAMLRHEMDVRRIALQQFGLANIPRGTPLSLLEAKLLPLYLHHRYQLQAAVKSVGGLYYTYAVKTEGGASPGDVRQVVPAARQREALAAVLDTLKVEELAVPPRVLAVMPPPAFGYRGVRQDVFAKHTGPDFDPLSAATVAADLAVSALLDSRRAARLMQYHALEASNPDFGEVVGGLVERTWRAPRPSDQYHLAIQRAVQSLVVTRLMDLAADDRASTQVRAVADAYLRALLDATAATASDDATEMHRRATHEDIERFLARPAEPRKRTPPPPTPPGDPIGAGRQSP